ncbi:MAG: hypothetical protein WCT18_01170 [Patescibacteria group bacterium]
MFIRNEKNDFEFTLLQEDDLIVCDLSCGIFQIARQGRPMSLDTISNAKFYLPNVSDEIIDELTAKMFALFIANLNGRTIKLDAITKIATFIQIPVGEKILPTNPQKPEKELPSRPAH